MKVFLTNSQIDYHLLVCNLFSLKNNLKSNYYVLVTACSPRSSPAPAAPGLTLFFHKRFLSVKPQKYTEVFL